MVGDRVARARSSGYRTMVLWTNDVLHEARRLYERAGFGSVEEQRLPQFGADLVSQTWRLEL
jgi:hypothetical protein